MFSIETKPKARTEDPYYARFSLYVSFTPRKVDMVSKARSYFPIARIRLKNA